MHKKILFSPIGGTDPIRYFRDGSMLHICRHYQPDIVYLYLSHEMMVCHKTDDRYRYAISKLGEYLGHSFDVRLIERDELVNVQQYDTFYQDFREIIQKIEEEMDDTDELLLNMASGTPAMKSSLLVIATLAEYRFHPIQVSTPQRRLNPPEEREPYDNEINWELNEDNFKDAPNRCEEIRCGNLMTMLKIENIKKHIRAYDYTAALTVAEEIKWAISEDAYRLLQIAEARAKLNRSKISKLLVQKSYDIYPIQEGDKQKIFEYALVLQMKVVKQEYADFIRGITPLVVDLYENILKSECHIELKNCCTLEKDKKNNNKEFWRWNRKKLKQAGLLTMLDQKYGYFREDPVYSHHISNIICEKSNDLELKQNVMLMTDKIEKNARNVAAHDIVSVTDEWFRKETGKSAGEILTILKYLIQKSGINAKKEDWRSYDRMNQMIESYLR